MIAFEPPVNLIPMKAPEMKLSLISMLSFAMVSIPIPGLSLFSKLA